MESMGSEEENRLYTMSFCRNESKLTPYSSDLRTIPDFLRFYADNKSDCEAIIFAGSDGSRKAVTFKDMYQNAKEMAKSFLKLGVRNSEIVAVSMRDCPEWLYVFFGAMMAGARPIALSLTYADGSDVIAMMKKLQNCSALVLDPGTQEENWRIFNKLVSYNDTKGNVRSDKMPYLRYLICHERPRSVQNVLTVHEMLAWAHSGISLPVLDPFKIALLLQTSGSTGIPRVVAHTHSAIVPTLVCIREHENVFGATKKLFNDRPFTWIGGTPMTMLIDGQTRVTLSKYCQPPEDELGFLIDVIKREKCTVLSLLPPLLGSLMENQHPWAMGMTAYAFDADKFKTLFAMKVVDNKSKIGDDWPVHIITTGGQPMSKKFARCIGKLCDRVVFIYASTEFLVACTKMIEYPEDFKEHLVGHPSPGIQLKIVNEKEEIVPVYTSGEIYIKSKFLFKEYFNDPRATKACITEDGWYRTDDVGFLEENGNVYCEGRKSEIIISGGMNVTPSILETTLEKHPGISCAVCVPLPHDVFYQVICACLILKHGCTVTETEIRNYLEELHNDKPRLFTVLPTKYMFMEKFPETHTGKVARKALTKYVTDHLQN